MDKRKIAVEEIMRFDQEKIGKPIVFITCDVGFSFLEPLQEQLGPRFLNLGVTECSSAVIAAALALQGFKVYFYSMIPFVLFRPGEMVRNMLVNHNADVTLLGVKGSEKYRFLGKSHNLQHEQEDVEFCKNIGLSHIVPNDTSEDSTRVSMHIAQTESRPLYIRL